MFHESWIDFYAHGKHNGTAIKQWRYSMDTKQTGRFIAELRRERGLTQDGLAGKLNVTNKAVSRWETGAGFPDVDSMMALSEFFGVSVNELLLGRRNPPPEREPDETEACELRKKEEAEIACGSLDLSVKKRRLSRIAVCLAALLAAVGVLAAVMLIPRRAARPEIGAAEQERWFSLLSLPEVKAPNAPARVIDLKTGEVWTACSDPECRHAENDEDCFFNRSKDRTEVYAAEYLENHIYFAAGKKTGDGLVVKLYDHDMETGSINEVYTYPLWFSEAKLYSSSMLFFTVLDSVEGKNKRVSLHSYDPQSGVIGLVDDDASFTLEDESPLFLENGYIFLDHYDEEKERLCYCKRSYDGSAEEYFDELPDGTPLEVFGYKLENGLFSNVFTGGVYVEEEKRCISLPIGSSEDVPEYVGLITSLVAYGDSFYYQTNSNDANAEYNELYVVSREGELKRYSIECPYRFNITAAYKNVVLGRVLGKALNNGKYADYQSYDWFIRIDLETGETQIYDAAVRGDAKYESFFSTVEFTGE